MIEYLSKMHKSISLFFLLLVYIFPSIFIPRITIIKDVYIIFSLYTFLSFLWLLGNYLYIKFKKKEMIK